MLSNYLAMGKLCRVVQGRPECTGLRQVCEMRKERNCRQLSKMFTFHSTFNMCTGEILEGLGSFKAYRNDLVQAEKFLIQQRVGVFEGGRKFINNNRREERGGEKKCRSVNFMMARQRSSFLFVFVLSPADNEELLKDAMFEMSGEIMMICRVEN